MIKLLFPAAAFATATIAFSFGTASGRNAPPADLTIAPIARAATPATPHPPAELVVSNAALSQVVQEYCAGCHNPKSLRGNLSLEDYDVATAGEQLVISEKIIRKLRAQMMPPPQARKPTGDTLLALARTLESIIDKSSRPNPGSRPFQRLNRPEYERAVRDLLGISISAADYLPLDTKSANFDNIADVQALSATLLDAYLSASSAVSRMAVGDRNAASLPITYRASPFTSQHPWDRVEGTPYGTRGGIVATHTFPADAQYSFRLVVGGGVGAKLEDIDISVNGKRVALLHYERRIQPGIPSADLPAGTDYLRSEPITIPAGQHKVSAAFVRRSEGPYEDLIKPHEWSRASGGTGSSGTTEPPPLMEMTIIGPANVTGISPTPSRDIVFSCRPKAPAEQRPCAEQIVTRLATKAYRRPLTEHDRTGLMKFYDEGAAKGDFEEGVRMALQAMLASPHFVFRIETAPAGVASGADYRISDVDLASRLSFFLWGSIPDEELLGLAQQKKLSDRKTLERQVERMLASPKSEALATRFASQWLRLQDLDKVHPDAFLFPDFTQQLSDAMIRETEMFFADVLRSDKSVLELYTANYTYLNGPLARHYGIPNVSGPEFRRVQYPDDTRRGLLGHGSILVQTSLANRTSPVLRGKYVMEVLIGMPPPPPPVDVPDLEQTKAGDNGRPLTTRERMEIHREDPTCNACHQYMDPIGLALDNFDVTARWRYRENGIALDTRGRMYDGSNVSTPAELTQALIRRPTPLVRSFAENLMAYAIGRRVEDFDQPAIRAIAKQAESKGYRMSSFIMGVVNSDAFLKKRWE